MFSYLGKAVGKRLPCMFLSTGGLLSFRMGFHCLISGFFFFTHKTPGRCQNNVGNTITVIIRSALKIPFDNGINSKTESKRKKVSR